MTSRRLSQVELARLDDAAYREYCRNDRMRGSALVHRRAGKTPVDGIVTLVLLMAIGFVVLHYLGVVQSPV